ncbi:hypothetical protein BJV82DRAFT_186786 [Fennellomyces sp. T-0311]|nr:hypothetical protein BJV82DRAFT_186786 [Fennellomyces sp. T-0311]
MTQRLLTVMLLLAVALAVCYAKCDCDAQDQDCVRKCVTDADVCITNCKGDTVCYEGCIGNKWPTDESIHVQAASGSSMPTATAAVATHSTGSHSSVSASSTHHASSSGTATRMSSATPSSTSAAAPSLGASLHWPVYALAAVAYLYAPL